MKTLRALAIGAMLTAAACSDKAKQQAAADSDLSRDLALAGAQTMQPQPTFQDTSMAPAPQQAGRSKEAPPAETRTRAAEKPVVHTPKPRPQAPPPQPVQTQAQAPAPAPAAAPAPAPAHAEIGAGTGFALTSGSKVCTTNEVGDKMVATLNSAVTGTNGAVIPAGSSVVLEVSSVNAGQNGDNASITFRVRSVVVGDKQYEVAADVTSLEPMQRTQVANSDPNADKKKVIGGAVAGAILGQLIGHSTKGTIIGAAAGAATGAAAAKMTQKYESCLPAGAPLRLTLNQPIVMS